MHEGIPIINFHVPKAFVHEGGKLRRHDASRSCRREYDAKGRRKLVPTGEPDAFFECDEVLVAVGQENAFPWIERDCGIDFDEWGLPVLDKDTFQSTRAATCSSAATRPSAPRTSSRPWRTATRRRCRSTSCCTARTLDVAPAADDQPDVAEDGHPRVELRQRHLATTCATRCRGPRPRWRWPASGSRWSWASTPPPPSRRRSAA